MNSLFVSQCQQQEVVDTVDTALRQSRYRGILCKLWAIFKIFEDDLIKYLNFEHTIKFNIFEKLRENFKIGIC